MTPELAKMWRHDPAAWQVAHTSYGYSIAYGTHEDSVDALLDDLLSLHFDGCDEGVPWYDFVRFVPNKVVVRAAELEGTTVHPKVRVERIGIAAFLSGLHEAVLDALTDPLVRALTLMDGDNIRLIADRQHLQLAMDTAGCWFEGYEPPEGTKTYGLTEKGKDMIEKYGVEGVVQLLINPDGTFRERVVEEGKG